VLVVAQRLRELPGDRRQALVLLLAPWVYLVCRDLYADTSPRLGSLLYPLVVIAVWVLRPRLDRLSLLGYLVGLTAVLSLAIAAFRPDKGLFTAVSGRLIAPDKQIVPLGVLVGPFTDGNNLAQFLVIGLATIGLVPRRGRRLLLGACTAFAIVFTSSRSSLAAMVAALLVGLVMAALPRVGRAVVGSVAVAIAITVMASLPLLTHDDAAFTNRGAVWRVGLREWSTDPFFGLGSRYYVTIGQFANALGGTAFHGHNQLVQTLVTGGLVYLALTAAMMATLVAAAVRWARWGRSVPVALLVAFFLSCTLEVSFGVVDRGFLFAVTVVPMAVLVFAPPAQTQPAQTQPPQTQPAQTQPTSTTPTSSALTRLRAATSAASWERRIHRPSATTTTPSTRRESARPSATRSTGGAFSSTNG
jgi:O-antigen ligase